MPLTGHFRANKNIAPAGGYLYTAVTPVITEWLADERMGKEGEIPPSLSALRIKAEWLPTASMIQVYTFQISKISKPRGCKFTAVFLSVG